MRHPSRPESVVHSTFEAILHTSYSGHTLIQSLFVDEWKDQMFTAAGEMWSGHE